MLQARRCWLQACERKSPPVKNSMLKTNPRSTQLTQPELQLFLCPGPAAAAAALAAWTCRPAANQDVDGKDEKKHDLGKRIGWTSYRLAMSDSPLALA